MQFADIQKLFEYELPGESAHYAFSPLRGSSSEALKKASVIRQSAVAVVLFNTEKELHCLVIERQQYDGTHSGQISFPGGKWEEADADYEATALRECFEEVGIKKSELASIGKLTEVFIPVSSFLIHPFVFWWKNPITDLIIQPREVASVHQINLELLFKEENKHFFDITINDQMTLKRVAHFVQDEIRIWGATAVILNELKELLRL